jgi:hypothetical protein
MTFFMVETYVVEPGKDAQFGAWMKKYFAWIEKQSHSTGEMKSHKMFAQMFGGKWGGCVEMWEFDSVADCESWVSRLMQDEEYMTEFYPERMSLMVPATLSIDMWKSVK